MSTSLNYNELDDLFAGGGSPAAKFKAIGDSITGVVTNAEARQQTDFDSGEAKTWDNGDPMMEIVLTLATSLRDKDVEDDDGERRVFCRGAMLTAMKQAIKKAKDTKPRIGGRVTVTYSGDGEAKKKGFSPPKLYTVAYEPPADVAVEAVFEEPPVVVDDAAMERIKNMDPAELAALLAAK